MKKIFQKITPGVGLFVSLIIILYPITTHAGGKLFGVIPDPAQIIADVAASAIGWTFYVINSIIAAIVGIFIAFVSYVIEVFLYLNTHVTESLAVQSGFKVAVSIANLGFVATIIVIAIATILRSQTYGIKKILWKLVVAALLVNFSLVIAGVIINFADGLALYFINAVNPAGNNFSNYTGFVSGLAGAFTPQRGFIFNASGTVNFANPAVKELQGSASAGQSIAAIFTPLFSLFFVSIFLILILLTLIALVVMLIIRYVYISVLLILMPFAWLFWIFPGLQSNWSKWWHNFLRWTFFAPIVMFFLFLAIKTSETMTRNTANNPLAVFQGTGFSSTANSPIIAGIQNFFGGFANQAVGTALQMIVVLALALGGLFAANSLSITGAKVAYGAATGAVKAVGGLAGRKGGGAAARFATHGPKPAPTAPPPEAKGFKAGLQRITYPFRKAAHTVESPLRQAAQATSKRLMPKEVFKDISEFGEKAKTSPGLLGSIYGGMKKGSGLFKGPKTKLSKAQAEALGLEIEGAPTTPTPTPPPTPTPTPTPSTP